MKRFIAVLSGLLVLPAFAEVAPIGYDEVIEYAEVDAVEDVAPEDDVSDAVDVPQIVQPSSVNPRAMAAGRNASRAVPAATNANTRSAGNRAVASSRNATRARTATATPQRATSARVATRTTGNASNQIATTRRAMTSNGANTARASIVQTDTVNTPLYTGRVSTRASNAIRARIPTITSTAATTAVTETAPETRADATAAMDELAQITDFCKAQYTQCMDNFCNVLDDNQGRCSCSKNIKNYAKTEEALKTATEALQDVAQQIQYIGLTGDEVETLFTQTEAELAMQGTTDNSQIKNDLDKIKSLIVDVKSGTASSTETGLSFDLSGLLDFSIDSTGFDLGTLFGGNQTNTSSISNQRGEQLYKTAAARCKAAVLTDCQKQGVDISLLTNSYDLEIDKQCVAYERQLTDTNDEMVRTVRNAKTVLQKARLMVAQQKNAYDMRGCINALDSCMQDDYVCGTDYELCLDPTGKYIVNGEIVIGSTPGYKIDDSGLSGEYSTNTLFGAWTYKGTGDGTTTCKTVDNKVCTAWGTTSVDGTLAEYVKASVVDGAAESLDATNMAKYLMQKIGYHDNSTGKNYGMCISVLNKCQDYTYKDNGYDPANSIIKEYMMRTLVQIKSAQDEILAEHAESCISDVSSCLSSNNFNIADKSRANIAINACRAQIKTCMSVNGDTTEDPTPTQIKGWVGTVVGCDADNKFYHTGEGKCVTCQGGTWDYDKNSCTCPTGTTLDEASGVCESTSTQ